MYRHFAIATLAITGCLAMFADGENQQAMQDQISQNAQRMAMKKADRKLGAHGKGGNSASNFKDNRTVKGSFGSDGGGGGGGSGSGGTGSSYGGAVYGGAQRIPGSRIALVDQVSPQLASQLPRMLPPGMSPREYLALKASERMKGQKITAASRRAMPGAPEISDPGAYLAASAAQSASRAK